MEFGQMMNSTKPLILMMTLSLLLSGCEAFVKFAGLAAIDMAEGAIEIVQSTDERRQARIDLEPRPESARTTLENAVLRETNSDAGSGKTKVKDVFCGNPPQVDHLPTDYFENPMYWGDDAPQECRAVVDSRFPDLASCYFIFEDGSSGYSSCYRSGSVESQEFSCMSATKILWTFFRDKEITQKCPADIRLDAEEKQYPARTESR